jgi:hypothetical protein
VSPAQTRKPHTIVKGQVRVGSNLHNSHVANEKTIHKSRNKEVRIAQNEGGGEVGRGERELTIMKFATLTRVDRWTATHINGFPANFDNLMGEKSSCLIGGQRKQNTVNNYLATLIRNKKNFCLPCLVWVVRAGMHVNKFETTSCVCKVCALRPHSKFSM